MLAAIRRKDPARAEMLSRALLSPSLDVINRQNQP
ncbi:MAG: hypothetical protein LPK06_06720 [Marinobacter sp.]|nr:hypothetical protein [Marinobacter sp.]